MRSALKSLAFAIATVAVLPSLVSYAVRAALVGRDRALEGSTQVMGLVPGIVGQYVRRAFLARVLAECHASVTVEFGTLFSAAGARLEENVYVGPRCHLGLVHLERDVLIAAGVHIPSGGNIHDITDVSTAVRNQRFERTMVRIGAGAWVGSSAVVMADVGRNTVVGAGAVVTRPLPDGVVAAGVPARVVRSRAEPAGHA
jgi:virginiamycin A acetyltransferase